MTLRGDLPEFPGFTYDVITEETPLETKVLDLNRRELWSMLTEE
jgi:hypothetical protein